MTQAEFNIELLKEGELICRNSQYCKGKQVGVHGRMFGADLMEELDAVCSVFAAEICDTPLVVTRTLNAEFLAPIKMGNVIKTYCGIESIGNTSINIVIEMRKYNVRSEAEVVCLRVNTTFVRIDEEGHAIPIGNSVKQKYDTLIKK
jgi:acyl-CoA hydrolase